MMRELIEYAINMDGMITAERTLYIMDMVEAESENELGAPLDRESIKYLYITNKALPTVTKKETAYEQDKR